MASTEHVLQYSILVIACTVRVTGNVLREGNCIWLTTAGKWSFYYACIKCILSDDAFGHGGLAKLFPVVCETKFFLSGLCSNKHLQGGNPGMCR